MRVDEVSVLAALVAACGSKACAPPPVGTGGSEGGLAAASVEEAMLESRSRQWSTVTGPFQSDEVADAGDELRHYCKDGYLFINEALRGSPEKFYSDVTKTKARRIDNAFKHFGVASKEPGVVYRGTMFTARDLGLEQGESLVTRRRFIRARFPVGATVMDRGYVSTSTERDIADHFRGDGEVGVLMHITIPKGVKVLAGSHNESEVLLPRGSRFKITHVEEPLGSDVPLHVHMELVPG